MELEKIPEEKKQKVIDLYIKTKTQIKMIAKQCEIESIDIYNILEEYCNKNGYQTIIREPYGIRIIMNNGESVRIDNEGEKIEDKRLSSERKKEKALEIKQWSEEHNRRPKSNIEGIKRAKKGEKGTEEQREIRLSESLKYLKAFAIKNYSKKEIEEIENLDDREIVKIVRELYTKYPNITMLKALEIKQWAEEHGRKPRQRIRKIEKVKNGKIEYTKGGEIEEQKEIELGRSLSSIKENVASKYSGKEIEEIENFEHKEIVKIIRELDNNFKDNRSNNKGRNKKIINEYNKKKLANMILNLTTTKKATMEQIEQIANYYGVDIEETMNALEEK